MKACLGGLSLSLDQYVCSKYCIYYLCHGFHEPRSEDGNEDLGQLYVTVHMCAHAVVDNSMPTILAKVAITAHDFRRYCNLRTHTAMSSGRAHTQQTLGAEAGNTHAAIMHKYMRG